jgi:hypothetical protein
MQEDRERWMQLARLAAGEKDPTKLMALVTEINLLLEKKGNRLNIMQSAELQETKSEA